MYNGQHIEIIWVVPTFQESITLFLNIWRERNVDKELSVVSIVSQIHKKQNKTNTKPQQTMMHCKECHAAWRSF